jgi:Zn-dependent oligopeptidase
MKNLSELSASDIALRQNIQEAILKWGEVPGTDKTVLVNGDVIEALLDVAAVYASMHGFQNYRPRNLAEKYTRGLANRIETLRRMPKPSNLKIVPRSVVN